MSDCKILFGGAYDEKTLFFSPTVIEPNSNAKVMEEEIFGPIMPIIEINSIEEGVNFIKSKSKPLAAYVFSEDKFIQDKLIKEISCGGICVNDTIVHISTATLPFGGVGDSGIGRYHGKTSFDTFSNFKSVMRRTMAKDLPIRFPPYVKNLKIVEKLIKYLG